MESNPFSLDTAFARVNQLANEDAPPGALYWRRTIQELHAAYAGTRVTAGDYEAGHAVDVMWRWSSEDGDLGHEYWTYVASLLR